VKAVVFAGPRAVEVREVPDAVLEEPPDVVIRVTSSAICGTDLHMYDGRTGAEPGLVLGHEPLGVVQQAGSAVELVKPGDRVVIPTHLYCGVGVNCARGLSAACLRSAPAGSGPPMGTPGWAHTAGPRRSCSGCPTPTPTASRCPRAGRRPRGRAGHAG
jgi:glutathione-independent formaldehyde dehydrogenase